MDFRGSAINPVSGLVERSPEKIPRTFNCTQFSMGAIEKFSGILKELFQKAPGKVPKILSLLVYHKTRNPEKKISGF